MALSQDWTFRAHILFLEFIDFILYQKTNHFYIYTIEGSGNLLGIPCSLLECNGRRKSQKRLGCVTKCIGISSAYSDLSSSSQILQ